MRTAITTERSTARPVKIDMDRVKVAFIAIVPALLFIAAAPVAFGASNHCRLSCFTGSAFRARPCAAFPIDSRDIVAHPAHVRYGKYLPRAPLQPFQPVPSFSEVKSPQAAFYWLVHSSRPLSVPWQFFCRAAAQPRAPSFVS